MWAQVLRALRFQLSGGGGGVERKDVPGGEMAGAETGSVDCIWQVTWSHRLGWKQIPLCMGREVEMLGGLFECQRQGVPQLNFIGMVSLPVSNFRKNGLTAVGFFFFGHTAQHAGS